MTGALFELDPIQFTVAAPDSKKNRGRVLSWGPKCPRCGRGSHSSYFPNPIAKKQQDALHGHLDFEISEKPHFGKNSVRVVLEHHARTDICVVRVEDLGPPPKGFTGRKRDLANLLDVILDAMQGPVYANDNQCSEILLRKRI